MPSLGGPPDKISSAGISTEEKSVFGHARAKRASKAEAVDNGGPACAGAVATVPDITSAATKPDIEKRRNPIILHRRFRFPCSANETMNKLTAAASHRVFTFRKQTFTCS
ncbi:MAG: hypothetical protein AMXMBFR74_19260 [Parvibaculum sp.]